MVSEHAADAPGRRRTGGRTELERTEFRGTEFRGTEFPIGNCLNTVPNGAIAQLGERLNGIQEVGGSTPPGSTISPIALSKNDSASEKRPELFTYDQGVI